jgi:hypothetical protein
MFKRNNKFQFIEETSIQNSYQNNYMETNLPKNLRNFIADDP